MGRKTADVFLFLFDSSQISVFITSFNVVMKQNIKPKQEHSNESLFEKKYLYTIKIFTRHGSVPHDHVFMKYREDSFSTCYWATDLTAGQRE